MDVPNRILQTAVAVALAIGAAEYEHRLSARRGIMKLAFLRELDQMEMRKAEWQQFVGSWEPPEDV